MLKTRVKRYVFGCFLNFAVSTTTWISWLTDRPTDHTTLSVATGRI